VKTTEIYVDTTDPARLVEWLESYLGRLLRTYADDTISVFQSEEGGTTATLTSGMEGTTFCSLYLVGANLPWSTDREMARVAFSHLGTEVRCDPGPDCTVPSKYLAITAEGEHIVDTNANSAIPSRGWCVLELSSASWLESGHTACGEIRYSASPIPWLSCRPTWHCRHSLTL